LFSMRVGKSSILEVIYKGGRTTVTVGFVDIIIILSTLIIKYLFNGDRLNGNSILLITIPHSIDDRGVGFLRVFGHQFDADVVGSGLAALFLPVLFHLAREPDVIELGKSFIGLLVTPFIIALFHGSAPRSTIPFGLGQAFSYELVEGMVAGHVRHLARGSITRAPRETGGLSS
jgi:hypothetical protein